MSVPRLQMLRESVVSLDLFPYTESTFRLKGGSHSGHPGFSP
jgi:hypothetical protein